MASNPSEPVNLLQALAQEAAVEYEQVQKELKEIEILIRQSTDEVSKLVQRNTQLANKVRQMEMNLDTYPRKDIRELYTSAGDAQMRLFMMRGQVEQLQARQQNLERLRDLLNKIGAAVHQGLPLRAGFRQTPPAEAQPALIARVIQAQEVERQRLARQMHDGPAQSLTNLILQAEICERLFESDPARARSELTALKNAVKTTFQRVRSFIFELRPMMLDDLGLAPTLRRYLQEFRDKTGLPVNFSLSGKERRLAPHTEVTIFRAVQRLLNNVHEHANATQVQVSLTVQEQSVVIVVEDDGRGFDVSAVLGATGEHRALGLATITNQVELLGGQMQIESSPGRGTRVQFELPVD